MWAALGNILIVLAIAGALGVGVSLFTIARQDGSAVGRALGILIAIAAVLVALYAVVGSHWL